MQTSDVLELTAATLEEEVRSSPIPVLVDFWAEWCPPCKAIAPILEGLASELGNRIRFTSVDIEAHPQVAVDYSVMAFPTLLVFRDGRPVKRLVGARGRNHLLEELAEFLS